MQTLVLNADASPINIIPWTRAVKLLMEQKVTVLDEHQYLIRSATWELPAPSVVVLNRYVKVKYRDPNIVTRRAVFARDRGMCQYYNENNKQCKRTAENLDHVIPKSRGGQHVWENVVAACIPCNSRKSDRTPQEAGLTLIEPPRKPPRWIHLRRHDIASWEPYFV